jgi:hypothetical protein
VKDLESAFADTAPGLCGGKACPEGWRSDGDRLIHALTAYLKLAGIDLGAHPGDVGATKVHDKHCDTGTITANLAGGGAVLNAQCFADTTPGGAPTPGRTGGSGGDVSDNLPGQTPTTVPGCPRTGVLTADCEWHMMNEGIPAIDIACKDGDPLYAPCNGLVIYRGLDMGARPRNGKTPPHPDLGLGIETQILCDGGMVVRFGHTKLEPLEMICDLSIFGDPDHFRLRGFHSCIVPGGFLRSNCDPALPIDDATRCSNRAWCHGDPIGTTHGGCCGEAKMPCIPGMGDEGGPPDRVKIGDIVAHCDNTGYSFGSHLHYETWVGGYPPPAGGGKRICPLDTLPARCP